MDDHTLKTLACPVLEAIQTWHVTHPRATLAEMDTALYPLLMQLQAACMQEMAQEQPEAHWAAYPETERPRCPTCQVPLRPHGTRPRRLQGRGGASVDLDRTYGVCPQCGTGVFPPGPSAGGAHGAADADDGDLWGAVGPADLLRPRR